MVYGSRKGAAEPSNYALNLQSMAVPQPNSVFLSLCLKIPRHALDMSLKNFCFFVFLSKNPPTRPRYVLKKLLFFCLSV